MSRTAAINALALALALVAAWWAATAAGPRDGAVTDAPPRFTRIASASAVADELVMALAEPARVVALSAYSRRVGARTSAFQDKADIGSVANISQIVALRPDLLLTHNITDPRQTARLREVGMHVVDLGSIEGVTTLLPDIEAVAELLGVPKRGLELRAKLEADLAAIAGQIPMSERRRGLYVTLVGKQLYGGTAGSSYHDVLTFAGVIDIASSKYKRWPAYSSEQLLELDPPMIVTAAGVERRICDHPGLDRLRACGDPDAIIAVDSALMGSAGLRIVNAARTLHEAVYTDR